MATTTRLRPYWLSWYSPASAGPPDLVWPWWWTMPEGGYGSRSACAAVMARNEAEAKRIIKGSYRRPVRAINWRFVMRKEPGWSPFCDRFPREPWMHWAYPEVADVRPTSGIGGF